MKKFNPVINDPVTIDSEFPPSMMPAAFYSENAKIVGTMFMAEGEGPHPVVLLLRGFPGNENNFDLAHSLKRAGFNVFVISYRGSWGSESFYSWKHALNDTEAAITFLQSSLAAKMYRCDKNKIILAGHSFGGFSALLSSLKFPEVKNIAMLTPFNFGGFAKYIQGNDEYIKMAVERMSAGSAIVHGTSGEVLWEEMDKNCEEWDLFNHVTKYADKNILLIGAEFDNTAPVSLHHKPLEETFRRAGARLESHMLKSGHSFANQRIKLAGLVVNWLDKIKFE